jgi:hypothetical protein
MRVADGTHVQGDGCLPTASAEGEARVLGAPVAVMDEPGGGSPPRDRHIEGVEDEFVRRCPAIDQPTILWQKASDDDRDVGQWGSS